MIKGSGGLSSIFRTSAVIGAMRFAALPLTIVTSIGLARVLGATDFGLVSFAISLAGLLAVPAGVGASQLVTRETIQAMSVKNSGLVNGLYRRTWQFLLTYSLIVLVSVSFFYIALGIGSISVIAAAVLAPFLARMEIDSSFMRAFYHPVLSQLCVMLLRPIAILLIYLGIWAIGYLNLTTVLVSQIAASAAMMAISLLLLHRSSPESVFKSIPVYNDRVWVRSYPPFFLLSGMNIFSVSIGIVWLGFIGDPEGVSGMRVAQSAGQLVQLPLVAVLLVVQPQLALKGTSEVERNAVLSSFIHGGRLALAGSLLICIPIFIFAAPLIGLLYGDEFVVLATLPTQLVMIGQVVNSAVGPTGMLLVMSGNEKFAFRGQLAGLTITVICVALLSPSLGATGAAIGIAIGLVIKNGVELIYLRRLHNRWLTPFSRLP